MKFIGIFLFVLALSIQTDAAKKKLLKKLAKELGYKLEDAIFKNIGDTVNGNKNEIDNVQDLQTNVNDNADNIEKMYVNSQLGCPVATDGDYEIIENMCFYFGNDFGTHDFASAQTACESKFPHGSGQLFEPKSLSHLQQVREAIQRRGMNCFYLGIDDSATETSYVYTSDNSHLVSTIESTIVVTNGCGPQKECDHLYTCDHITQINTIWSDYQLVDLVCVNVRTPEDCPVSTDDRYEIVNNRCLYFEDEGSYGFNLAQTTCASAFVNGPGRVYEPTSVSNLQKVREIATRRGINCFFLGIDDSLIEGTYLYTSDNSHVDLGVKSKIVVTNGCGPQKDCDHLYTCKQSTVNSIIDIYTTSSELLDASVCENVNALGGNFGTLQGSITKLEDTNAEWFHAYKVSSQGSPNAMTTITYDFVRPSYMTDAMDYLTGVFTARVSGDYQFNFQGRNKPSTYAEMYLKKNDVYVSHSLAEDTGRNAMFGTAILALQVGDKVWVVSYGELVGGNIDPIHFTGAMLNMA